jgi:hypothetical protein
LQILLSPDLEVSPELNKQFLLSLGSCRSPVSFEILADYNEVTLQMCCDESFASHLKNQIETFFPTVL